MKNLVQEAVTLTDMEPSVNAALDPKNLASELASLIEGEVRFDDGSRALYATDASNYRQVPIGVVVPRHREDVIKVLAVCRRYGAPVLARGGGTSLAGQCCNFAVVMDMSKYMNRILAIDAENKTAVVEPGVVLDDLQKAAKPYGLMFGPDPSTHSRCTFGGMIGNNSCGIHSVLSGKMVDNVESLEILTYDGTVMTVGKTTPEELERIVAEGGRKAEIYQALHELRHRHEEKIRQKFPKIPRRVSGYNLDELLPENGFHVARALVGTEGTCVTVLSATVRLLSKPKHQILLILGFEDLFQACDQICAILEHGPIGLEGLDERLIHNICQKEMPQSKTLQMLPEGEGYLVCEFAGESHEEAKLKAEKACKDLSDAPGLKGTLLVEPEEDQQRIWAVRESGLGATAFVPGKSDSWPGWEDSAVAPAKMGGYVRELRKLMDEYGYEGSFYGHFGDGCLHTRISFDLASEDGVRTYRRFLDEAADLVIRYEGSLSGEHGDGQARGELLGKMFGEELLDAFRRFKQIWDPEGKMNPGKVVDPYPITEDLRLQQPAKHPKPKTYFRYAEDDGDFLRSTLRCVGVGKCRRKEGGTMCPSYKVTLEEKHSTRGRAHLLYEMLQGDVVKDGWKDEHVKEALDLCLSCKGCKSDCPVNVDIATYKAEFLAHYYKGRLRPRHAYALGWIHRWARLASWMPALANFMTQTPGLSALMKKIAGIAPERRLPEFASKTYTRSFRKTHEEKALKGTQRVILWPDTFNNHFYPEVLKAGTEVLEHFGFQVELPAKRLCCGRPLYDYGMLGTAKRLLLDIMTALEPSIEQAVPVVGFEPSCIAVFRDELINLFPDDERAQKLSKQVYTLSEFLEKFVPQEKLPSLKKVKGIIQGHCHHKAIMGMAAERKVLAGAGMDHEILDSGCCGMAGAFGFEKRHYEISVQCGESALLPRVRKTPADEIIMADGFSCREQIRQLTGRKALHLAQVLQKSLRSPNDGIID